MLVLTRKVGERLLVGDAVVVTVVAAGKGQVRIGIAAPSEVRIIREELLFGPRSLVTHPRSHRRGEP